MCVCVCVCVCLCVCVRVRVLENERSWKQIFLKKSSGGGTKDWGERASEGCEPEETGFKRRIKSSKTINNVRQLQLEQFK